MLRWAGRTGDLYAGGLYEGLATVTDIEKELKVLPAAGDVQAVFQFTKEKSFHYEGLDIARMWFAAPEATSVRSSTTTRPERSRKIMDCIRNRAQSSGAPFPFVC
jgi:hypothetical protein